MPFARNPVGVNIDWREPRTEAELIRELKSGPVTLTGPNPEWCLQGLLNDPDGYVHIEILDPVYWGRGAALPAEHVAIATELGFEATEGMWILQIAVQGERDIENAAQVMRTFMQRAWE